MINYDDPQRVTQTHAQSENGDAHVTEVIIHRPTGYFSRPRSCPASLFAVMRRVAQLGGLPKAAAVASRGGGKRPNALSPRLPRTSRDELLSLLKRKSWQVRDVDRHPLVLGVPLGQDGGTMQGVSVDIGLKNMAVVSMFELANASPEFKLAIVESALDPARGDQRHEDLLRQAAPVPMAVMTKEDIMKLPVAAAVHPRALERTLSEDKRNLLKDPFFRNNPPCDELQDLVVEAVPGADANVEARENFKREERNSRIRSRG